MLCEFQQICVTMQQRNPYKTKLTLLHIMVAPIPLIYMCVCVNWALNKAVEMGMETANHVSVAERLGV